MSGSVSNVCIFGGTHGNEMSGIFLLKKWKTTPSVIQRSSCVTNAILANPEAVKVTRRYCDLDLNRMFTKENLEGYFDATAPYEVRRVQELKSMFSVKGDIGPCDLVLDMHNTTANMKVCAIYCKMTDFVLHMLNYLSSNLPEGSCRNLYYPSPEDHTDTTVLAKQGIALEVGPQPQGVLREDIMKLHEDSVLHCLDFVELYNSGFIFDSAIIETYEVGEYIKFPCNTQGMIDGVIHSSLQDKDWDPIKSTDPVFTLFNGSVIRLRDVVKSDIEDDEVFYPCFINEAAYYEKDTAFILCKKKRLSVPKLQKL